MSPGDRLAGRFVLGDRLGHGAIGEVWAAWDEAAERQVAVKLLHEGLAGDPGASEEIEDGVTAAGRLRHPHVVEVFGLWTHGARRFLVSELVAGRPLAARDATMSLEGAILVAMQVAEALAHAHASGVVHGDLRPGNVLLAASGARVFDFGLGSRRAGTASEATIRPGETAPELVDGAPPSRAADLYGLGVVLVHAATGAAPFAGATPFATLTAQRAGPPPLDGLPRGLRSLARALLDPRPDLRPADARAVVRALTALHRHPSRIVGFGGRWFAPIRPLRAWVVHGRDPATGGPAVIRAGLGRAPARALVARLRAEGWQVEASREALDVVDLAWAGFAGLFASAASPLVGFGLMAPLVLRWRSAGVRDRLREALPPVRAPLPPRRLPPGNEVAVAAGLLMFAAAASLLVFPPFALPIVACLVWLAGSSWSAPADRATAAVRTGRVETALAEAHALLEAGSADFDTELGLYGEWVAVDRDWRAGVLEPTEAVDRLDGLTARVAQGRARRLVGAAPEEGPERRSAP